MVSLPLQPLSRPLMPLRYYRIATVAAILVTPVAAVANNAAEDSPATASAPTAGPAALTSEELLANSRRFARRQSREDCMAQRQATGDIIVCGSQQGEGLPVPEVYGPVAGSSDGSAIDPRGVPCGASISNNCYEGLDMMAIASATVGVVLNIIDPDRNLGEGTRLPQRFRGANR